MIVCVITDPVTVFEFVVVAEAKFESDKSSHDAIMFVVVAYNLEFIFGVEEVGDEIFFALAADEAICIADEADEVFFEVGKMVSPECWGSGFKDFDFIGVNKFDEIEGFKEVKNVFVHGKVFGGGVIYFYFPAREKRVITYNKAIFY